jgi:hypothetical protein
MLLLVYSYNETYTMKPLKSRAIRYVQLLQFVSGLTLSCLIFNYYLWYIIHTLHPKEPILSASELVKTIKIQV